MMVKSYTINVDIVDNLAQNGYSGTVYNQGDINSAILNINITQDEKPYDLTGSTVSVVFNKPDGTVVYQDSTNGLTITNAVNGNISVNLNTQTLTAVGKVTGAIKIVNGTTTVETGTFSFTVKKSMASDAAIASQNNIIPLQGLIKFKSFTATSGQTVFDLSDIGSYTPGQNRLNVTVGGVWQPPTSYTETNATTFTLSEPLAAGTVVNVEWTQGGNMYIAGHNTTHQLGGGDALDVTKLVNYTEQIATPISNINASLADMTTFAKTFGAVGDGIVDDTNAIKTALLDAVTNKRKRITFEKGKRYKITAPIIIPMGTMKHFEVDFNFATIYMGTKFSYTSGLLAFNFDTTLTDTCLVVENGYFDGSGYQADWVTSPPVLGSGVIHAEGARTYIVDNCHFNDWFLTSAIFSLYSDTIKITNCTGVNVGGTASSSSYDNAGDAIYIAYNGYYASGNHLPSNVLIENCFFKSYPVVVPTDSTPNNSFHSGRCGVVIGEYANQSSAKNFTINNSYFYNYQRCFHIENSKNVHLNVNNCTIEDCGNTVLISHDNCWDNILFKNCNIIKNNNVRGMYNGFNHIIYGANDALTDTPSYTKENVFKFDTCTFTGYISLVGAMKATDCVVDNCQVTSFYHHFYNCRIRAINSKFKLNSNQVQGSIYNFEHCRIELGYLHDTNSIYVLSCTTSGIDQSLSKLSIIDKCRFLNTTLYQSVGSTISLLNSEFTYDSNFNLKSYSGVTISGIFDLGVDQIRLIENCKFINNSGTTFSFFAYNVPSAYDDMLVSKNTFKGFNVNIFGTAHFKVTFDNNKFYLNSLALTWYIKSSTLLVITRNNYFFELSSGELSLATGSLNLNNYRLAGSTATVL